jgi:anti-sigma B factor antagonist
MTQASVVTSSAASPYFASPFSCTFEEGGPDAAWVRLAGEVDLATAPQLEQTLREAQRSARLIVLDLRELTFMDCRGVHVILDAARDARQVARRLVLVRGRANVDRVLTVTGVCAHLEIVDLDPGEGLARALLQLPVSLFPA